jgi:4-hydroxy-tetrahydrodipicolinate synthase
VPAPALGGSFTALVTPIRAGRIDVDGLVRNVGFQIEHGTSGIVPCGTTGEAPTLGHDEWQTVIATTVQAAGGRVPVIPGTGSNSTGHTIALTREAESLGAQGALVVSPYYNKPTQEGLYRHFRAVAESTTLPIVVYNIAGRTGVNILPETLERLARDCPNIQAVKEASGSLDQTSEILACCADRLTVLSGDDSLTLPIMAAGGMGVVSVASNIVPRDVAEMCRLVREGRLAEARVLHQKLFRLCRALFIETNPIPVKTAMNLLGMAAGELRLPLCEPSREHVAVIEAALRSYGLLRA